MKKIILFMLLSLGLTAYAAGKYDAKTRKLLDEAVTMMTQHGGVSFNFLVINQPNTPNQTRTSGSMDVDGRKFFLQSTEMLSWYNGAQQWSMTPGDTEVSLSEPSQAEQQSMNPTLLLQLYKKGFYYKMKEDKLSNGEQGYKIYLNADNKNQKIREMYVEINKNKQLVRISLREGKKNWMRIVLSNVKTGKRFDDNHFTFPQQNYPHVEIIDIR